MPGWDIIFIARSPSATADYDSLKKSIEGLLSQARLLVEDYERACLSVN